MTTGLLLPRPQGLDRYAYHPVNCFIIALALWTYGVAAWPVYAAVLVYGVVCFVTQYVVHIPPHRLMVVYNRRKRRSVTLGHGTHFVFPILHEVRQLHLSGDADDVSGGADDVRKVVVLELIPDSHVPVCLVARDVLYQFMHEPTKERMFFKLSFEFNIEFHNPALFIDNYALHSLGRVVSDVFLQHVPTISAYMHTMTRSDQHGNIIVPDQRVDLPAMMANLWPSESLGEWNAFVDHLSDKAGINVTQCFMTHVMTTSHNMSAWQSDAQRYFTETGSNLRVDGDDEPSFVLESSLYGRRVTNNGRTLPEELQDRFMIQQLAYESDPSITAIDLITNGPEAATHNRSLGHEIATSVQTYIMLLSQLYKVGQRIQSMAPTAQLANFLSIQSNSAPQQLEAPPPAIEEIEPAQPASDDIQRPDSGSTTPGSRRKTRRGKRGSRSRSKSRSRADAKSTDPPTRSTQEAETEAKKASPRPIVRKGSSKSTSVVERRAAEGTPIDDRPAPRPRSERPQTRYSTRNNLGPEMLPPPPGNPGLPNEFYQMSQ